MSRTKAKISRGPHGLWATQDLGDGWTVDALLVRQGDTLVIGEIRISLTQRFHMAGQAHDPDDQLRKLPPGGIPATVLRRIRLTDIFDEVRRQFETIADVPEEWRELHRAVWLDRALKTVPRYPGRRGRDDAFYASVAAAYVTELDRGSRRPVADVAERLGWPPGTVTQIIHEARRRRGLLTASPEGRAGGQLTAKARKLLMRGVWR